MDLLKHTNLQNDLLLIAVGVVGALGAIVMIYASVTFSSVKFTESSQDLLMKKSRILAMVESKEFLTSGEKEIITRELIGEKIKIFSFTPEEINKILTALNKD